MTLEFGILAAGGLVAGVINTLAGGGSFLTVPLLILLGVPPTDANATNRLGIVVQSLASLRGFHQEGVREMGPAWRLLPAVLLGAWLGAWLATWISDELFQRAFGVIMLLALPVVLMNPKPTDQAALRQWPVPLQHAIYFAIGFYGGAIQAGIGIALLLALVIVGGFGLVRANGVKVGLIAALNIVALAQFIWAGKIFWIHGLVLAAGSGLGGYVGSRFGARIGERLIRPVLIVAVLVLAFRMLF